MSWMESIFIRLFESLGRIGQVSPTLRDTSSPGLRIGQTWTLTDRRVTEPYAIGLTDFGSHLVSLGSSGGGKTSLIAVLLVGLLKLGHGGLVIDIHDAIPKLLSLVARLVTAGLLPERVLSRIVVVSFSDDAPSIRFNPLARVPWLRPYRVGQHMELILRRQWPDATWGAPSTELIANTFCLMAEHGLPLTMTEQLLRNPALVHRYCQNVSNEACRSYFLNRWLHFSDAMRNVYTQVFLPRLNTFLAYPRLRTMFGSQQTDLDLFQCMQERRLILFDLNKGILGRDAELVANIVLAVQQQAAFARLTIPEELRHPSTLVIDEFNALAAVHEIIAPALNEFRKLQIPVVLSGQSLTGMDRAMRSTILTNCAVRCCFRMDAENLKFATAELQGEERELIRRQIARLGVGKAFVFVGGRPPREVAVDYWPVPNRLSQIEEQMVHSMYHNIGAVQPLTEASYHPEDMPEVPNIHRPQRASAPDLPTGYTEGEY